MHFAVTRRVFRRMASRSFLDHVTCLRDTPSVAKQALEVRLMAILLWLNIILWLAGFVLPVPCFALACRAWLITKNAAVAKPWRRWISHLALAAFAVATVFWAFVAIQQYRGGDFYGTATSYIGVFGSTVLIIPSAFAEGKLRLWLIIGAIGILSFFGISTGEAAI